MMQGLGEGEREVRDLRREKDEYFAGPDSPLPAWQRDRFQGLPYFDFDSRLRFEVALEEGSASQSVTIQRTGGDTVVYERAGTFSLRFPERDVKLTAFRSDAHGEDLFIPFRDSTTGKETYDVGRYLEAVARGGRYLVDFNRAYNPFCAYNEHFTCPLVPRENWLKVPVKAGEKKPTD